jgi:hypothetical protein
MGGELWEESEELREKKIHTIIGVIILTADRTKPSTFSCWK